MFMPAETFIAYLIASSLLCLAPGPDNMFVLAQSALKGARTGLLIILGLCLGSFFHVILVALGIAAILKSSPVALVILKIIGASYLLWLAFGAVRSAGVPLTEENNDVNGSVFLRGAAMSASNPKLFVFFLAFFPQFIDPTGETVQLSVTNQIFLLGLLFLLVVVITFGAIAFAASSLGPWIKRSERARKNLNYLTACVFSLMALKLVLTPLT